MMQTRGYSNRCLLLITCVAALTAGISPGLAGLQVSPSQVELYGPEASVQVIATVGELAATSVDRTRQATYRVADSTIATVSATGLLTPHSDGATQLIVRVGDEESITPILVKQFASPKPVSFRTEVIPLLTKAGCNAGGCHGKAEGQNGFKLSIFGFDDAADHEALTQQARGRRVMVSAPTESLLLLKATGSTPHGGGAPLSLDSLAYRRLLRWITEGAAFDGAVSSQVTRIEVEPSERVLAPLATQQLRVVAHYDDGQQRDVTAEAAYESNNPAVVEADSQGYLTVSEHAGEGAVLVRHMDQVAICHVRVPNQLPNFQRPPEVNFIDRHAWNKLQQMGIQPSDLCDDATYLRRVSLDLIGTLPTTAETQAFLADDDPNKRAKLVDALLKRDEYATYAALRWSDLLRVDANALGPQPAYAMSRWLRRQFAQNRPYDQMVREILLAHGSPLVESPAPLYLALNDPKEAASSISQLFLGVRIECAECHHHPFEKWSQRDFVALAGFFTGLKRKRMPDRTMMVTLQPGSDLRHPRTGEVVPAAGLGQTLTEEASAPGRDRRQGLADWMTDDSNPLFARAIANRMWSWHFGRGLVEPVDDMRATNPAVNEPLLAALADHLREVDYDLQAFTRTLVTSRTYQLRSETNPTNQADTQYFSHAMARSLPAEVLLDAICQVTESPEKFDGWPAGARGIEVWDSRVSSYFFRIFGRPLRTSVCSCERGDAPSIAQALHLLNSPEIAAKVHDRHGLARRLAESDSSPAEIVDELYLAALSRRPTTAERQLMVGQFDATGVSRREAAEDVLWTVLNTKEFLFNH